MKRIRSFFFIAAAIVSISIVSLNAQTNSGLAKQVTKKILALPNYGVFDVINFEINGGIVTLKGKVASLGTKADAEMALKKIAGVSEVVNNIEELAPSATDDQIRVKTLQTFASKGMYRYFKLPNPEVRIIVENGHITLTGRVDNKADSDKLGTYAKEIPGTSQVTNEIVVSNDSA